MTWQGLVLLMAYDHLDPQTEERADIRSAMVAREVADVRRMFSPNAKAADIRQFLRWSNITEDDSGQEFDDEPDPPAEDPPV